MKFEKFETYKAPDQEGEYAKERNKNLNDRIKNKIGTLIEFLLQKRIVFPFLFIYIFFIYPVSKMQGYVWETLVIYLDYLDTCLKIFSGYIITIALTSFANTKLNDKN